MSYHRNPSFSELILWAAAFTALMVLLAMLSPPKGITPLSPEEKEQIVQECIDIFTMEGNANIAACLNLRS